MQGICCRSDDQIHPGWAVVQAKKRIYLYVQNYKTTNNKYVEDFEAYVKVQCLHNDTDLNVRVSRDVFEELAADTFERLK